jgi:hypothetical protein
MQTIEAAELDQHRRLLAQLTTVGGDDEDASQALDDQDGNRGTQGPATEEQHLWVQQYMPRSYLQLLSAEAVNVGVLAWLRSWDAAVFNKQPKAKLGSLLEQTTARATAAAVEASAREDRRPKCKGILLAGNPGVPRNVWNDHLHLTRCNLLLSIFKAPWK